MMLIDSNIIIYATYPDHEDLRRLIEEQAPFVSAVSYVEVLGYHKLKEQERIYLEMFFEEARVLPLSQEVLDQAVLLRQYRKMTLGDALVAGTAITHNLTLITRNIDDFQWIEGLTIFNPFDISKKH
jgi:hypothetical protein